MKHGEGCVSRAHSTTHACSLCRMFSMTEYLFHRIAKYIYMAGLSSSVILHRVWHYQWSPYKRLESRFPSLHYLQQCRDCEFIQFRSWDTHFKCADSYISLMIKNLYSSIINLVHQFSLSSQLTTKHTQPMQMTFIDNVHQKLHCLRSERNQSHKSTF